MSKPDPKAKVRNKPSPVFDAKHPKVKDNKDHFPLGSESQARNALARANQFKKAPEWWSGTLEQLVSAVVKAVGKEYKGIEISDKSKKPGKGAELINTLTKLAVDNSEIYTDIISEIKHKVASNQSFRGWKATELNLLLAELGEAQVKIAEDEKKQSYNYGECPDEAITEACMQQCPDGFPMTIRSKDEWRALAEAWNQGIDSHLEGMARSTADNTTGKVLVHPSELCTLLRRLNNSDNEVSSDLRSGILQSLGIEEI
jgi:hypothetical protein